MNILSIETSCDETSAAVVENGTDILSNVIATQIEFHQKYGGIVPEIASRKHIEVISPIIQQALDKANIQFSDLDAIAVTYGPGLVGALLVGVCAAKAIAYSLKIPLIGVNHLEGHICANFLSRRVEVRFPFICLIVSGGHTSLVLVKGHGEYQTIGRTRDDAAGEVFDKISRFLGLGYPGGPIIDEMSRKGNPSAIDFPRAMMDKEYGYDFSFSGIKTAVVNHVKKWPVSSCRYSIEDLLSSFQEAVVDVLVEKSICAAKEHNIRTIALAGGVSCNSRLRTKMLERGSAEEIKIIFPAPILCTDNAAMIACAGYFWFKKGITSSWDLKAVANLEI